MSEPEHPKNGTLVKPEAPRFTPMPPPEHHALGLRTVAIFEAAKGLLVLIAGLGLLSLIHRDAQQVAEQIVQLMHLNPARRYPEIFIIAASHLNDARLWSLSLAAIAYSTVRFVEAYGLWHERSWAEWFAVLSGGIFLPVEFGHFIEKQNVATFAVILINIGIVVYLAYVLIRNSRHKVNEGSRE